MNKNKQTFAARAKQIIKKYKRASFDAAEKKELDDALAALAQEQEAYKQANGIGEYSPENMQAEQGVQQFPDGGYINGKPGWTDESALYSSSTGMLPMAAEEPIVDIDLSQYANQFAASTTPAAPAITGKSPLTAMGSTSGVLPSIIGGIASGVGNLVLSGMSKPVEMKATYTPEQISLARQRERLGREAGTATNIATRGLRGTGNRGAYLAGAGTAVAGVNKNLSDALGQSYLTEEQMNLEQRNKAQDYRNQVKAMNWQARQQAQQDKQAYRSAAISTIPAVMTDINRIQSQNALLESLGSQNYAMQPSTGNRVRDILLGRTLYGTLRK